MLHIEPYHDADRLQTAALIYAAFCDKFQRARRLSPPPSVAFVLSAVALEARRQPGAQLRGEAG